MDGCKAGTSNAPNETEQSQRSELRERYLRLMSNLGEKQVDLQLYENTNVKCKFIAMKADNTHFAVDSLQTPIGVVNHAVIRSADTITITADLNDLTTEKFQ